jgi:hypothetical protein
MKTSSVSFSSIGSAGGVSDFDALDDEVRGVLASLVSIDSQIAVLEGARTRWLAKAAELADQRAAASGRSATAAGREMTRRSMNAEIGCATRRSERTVARLVDESGHLVGGLAATLREVEAGRITYAHARAVVAHARTLPEAARPDFEAQVLPFASTEPAYRFDDRARRLRERAHPESIAERVRAARDERYVGLEPGCDGMSTLVHHLAAAEALAIDDLVDKMARAMRSDDDSRSHAQRRSDALTGLVLGDGERRGITPTVLITVPATTIAGVSDELGELHGYGPIDAETAREIASWAPTFIRALTSPDSGEPLVVTRHRHRPVADSGDGGGKRAGYVAPALLRTALMVADETCRFPNCSRRAGRCELDHTCDWALGGETTADNLAHLCSRHHHLKHDGGWTVAAGRGRRLSWTSPSGGEYSTAPAVGLGGAAPPGLGARSPVPPIRQ